jgi:hypothetical protein
MDLRKRSEQLRFLVIEGYQSGVRGATPVAWERLDSWRFHTHSVEWCGMASDYCTEMAAAGKRLLDYIRANAGAGSGYYWPGNTAQARGHPKRTG